LSPTVHLLLDRKRGNAREGRKDKSSLIITCEGGGGGTVLNLLIRSLWGVRSEEGNRGGRKNGECGEENQKVAGGSVRGVYHLRLKIVGESVLLPAEEKKVQEPCQFGGRGYRRREREVALRGGGQKATKVGAEAPTRKKRK